LRHISELARSRSAKSEPAAGALGGFAVAAAGISLAIGALELIAPPLR